MSAEKLVAFWLSRPITVCGIPFFSISLLRVKSRHLPHLPSFQASCFIAFPMVYLEQRTGFVHGNGSLIYDGAHRFAPGNETKRLALAPLPLFTLSLLAERPKGNTGGSSCFWSQSCARPEDNEHQLLSGISDSPVRRERRKPLLRR